MIARALKTLISIAAIACVTVSKPAFSAETSIVGTWQLTDYSQETIETKAITTPFGDHPTGYIQYSPGGHVVVCLMSGDVPRPASSAYTDAERAAIFKTFVGIYAGTYSAEGNKVIHHVLTAWRPEWIGGDQTRFYELNGSTLKIRTAPIKSTLTGQDIISILTFVRVE